MGRLLQKCKALGCFEGSLDLSPHISVSVFSLGTYQRTRREDKVFQNLGLVQEMVALHQQDRFEEQKTNGGDRTHLDKVVLDYLLDRVEMRGNTRDLI
mmetsp:Transcript_36532/g.56091  ORF Transcript_36532/g.56091 Transcript_36532/m.56091 type:complete len:98 (-) Transcript_36532:1025-1318(-)